MSNTTFVSGTLITAAWLNDVNKTTYAPNANKYTVTSTNGQTVFTLPVAYSNGTYTLRVYVGGVFQIPVSSYAETNATTVTFTAGIPGTLLVTFLY